MTLLDVSLNQCQNVLLTILQARTAPFGYLVPYPGILQ